MSKLLNIDTNKQLLEILSQFDLNLKKIDEESDFYFQDELFPRIASQAFEMERYEESVIVQLDIHLLLPEQVIVESFVANAPSIEEAIAECFEQFEVNVLHTLIMAFWDKAKRVENGVGTDIWEINGYRWQIVVSNYGYRGAEPMEEIISDIGSIYDEIEKAIKVQPLVRDIYAFRTVYTNTGNGQSVTEALINNEPFIELESAVSNLDWKEKDSFYSVRNFVIAMKLAVEE